MSWKSIVVGVDVSAESAGAAALGWRIAQAAKTRCHLVHACAEPATERSAREQLEVELEGSIPLEGLNVLLVRPGRPAAVLAEVVAAVDAGLVVLGGKHHSALNRWLGGSTAHTAARTLPVPVLVATGPATAKRRILAAVDLSPAARPTIAAAEAMAALFGGQLRVLHVVEPIPVLPEVPLPFDLAALEAETAARFLREIWPLVTAPGAQQEVCHGIVPEAIVQAAADWRADLLVVGSHGRGWIDRMILGSVTERLLNNLTTSLLVVPTLVAEAAVVSPARHLQVAPLLAPA